MLFAWPGSAMIPYTQSNVQITAVVKSTLKKCDDNNNNIHYNRNKKNKKETIIK